ncbi:MAG: hypothetical protein ACREBC_39740 [Pyrinomonadaceae bacterium]
MIDQWASISKNAIDSMYELAEINMKIAAKLVKQQPDLKHLSGGQWKKDRRGQRSEGIAGESGAIIYLRFPVPVAQILHAVMILYYPLILALNDRPDIVP